MFASRSFAQKRNLLFVLAFACLHAAHAALTSITVQPTDQTVLADSSAVFNVTASSVLPVAYQWRKAGAKIPGATNRSLTLPSAQFSDQGFYDVVVSNVLGTATSFPRRLFVSYGRLAAWQVNDRPVTAFPPGLTNIIGVVAGVSHGAAVKTDGTVVAWGNDDQGQTDVPAGLSNVVALSADSFQTFAIKANGTVVRWGTNIDNPTLPPGLTNIVAIAAGDRHTLALRADGKVITWGNNSSGQTNVPAGLSNVVAVAAGASHSLALKADGTVIAWGDNSRGQKNIPGGLSNVVAIASGYAANFNLALKKNGTVVAWGDYSQFQYNTLGNATNAFAIAANDIDALAIGRDGTIVSLNNNNLTRLVAGNPAIPHAAGLSIGVSAAIAFGDALPVPVITQQPADQLIRVGDEAQFTVSATGASPLTYQWYYNGFPITDVEGYTFGATTTNLTILTFGFEQGDYTVVVSSPSGSTTSTVATLTFGTSPEFTVQPQSQTNFPGTSASFSALASGTEPITYQWLFNGNPFEDGLLGLGATNFSLTLYSINSNSVGEYSLVASNALGAVTSSVATLSLFPRPTITSTPPDSVVAIGSDATLHVSAIGEDLHYQWYFLNTALADGGSISGSGTDTLAITNIQIANSGTYRVVVTNPAGSATSRAIGLYVAFPPQILTQPVSLTNTVGQNFTLNATATGSQPLTRQWYFNDVPLVNNSNVTGADTDHLTVLTPSFSAAGDYWMVASNLVGVVTSAVATVTLIPVPPNFLLQPVSQTNQWGASIQFQTQVEGSLPLYLQWYLNDQPLTNDDHFIGTDTDTLLITNITAADVGAYQLLASNMFGVATSAVATFTIIPTPPIIYAQPQSRLVFAGTNVSFATLVFSPAPVSWQWFFNGTLLANNNGHISGADSNVLTIQAVSAADIGDYQSVAANYFGAVTSTVAHLDIFLPPVINTNPVDKTGYVRSNVTFDVSAIANAPLTYQWRVNGTNLSNSGHYAGALTNRLTISNLVTTDMGGYDVVISDLAGSVTSSVANLTILDPPAFLTPPAGRSARTGWSVTFSPTIAGALPRDYQWLFNGQPIPDATNVNYTVSSVTASNFGDYQLVMANIYGVTTSSVAPLTFSEVFAWGNNESGQTNLPPGLTNIVAIAAGGDNSSQSFNLALRGDGRVIAWGNNSYGQTNVPSSATNVVAIDAGGTHCLALRNDGRVIAWGLNSNGQTNVPSSLGNVVAISAGSKHSLALRADGRVVGWGDNAYTYPYLTLASNLVGVTSISAGVQQSLALRGDGRVFAFGAYSTSFPPPRFTDFRSISTEAGDAYPDSLGVGVRSNGTVVVWGTNNFPAIVPPAGLTNVTAAALGYYYGLALQSNGQITAWGNGAFGTLAPTNVPAGASNAVAIAAGYIHALALVNDGQPVILQQPVGGTNWSGRAQIFTTRVAGASPLTLQWQFNGTNLPDATNTTLVINDLTNMHAGSYQLIVSNAFGIATSVPALLSIPVQLTNIAFYASLPRATTNFPGSAFWLNASVSGNGPLSYQWKFNGTNIIPGATNADFVIPRLLTTNGGIYSVTVTPQGFGIPLTAQTTQLVTTVRAFGYLPVQPNFVVTNAVGGAVGYSGIQATPIWNLALASDRNAYAWPSPAFYPPWQPYGVSNSALLIAIAPGYNHFLGLRTDGSTLSWSTPYLSSDTTNSAFNAIAVACGDSHDMALRSDGSVVAWGSNIYGQTTVSNTVTNIIAIAAGQNHSLALRADGRVLGWGLASSFSGMTESVSNSNVIAISAGLGANFTAALRYDGRVVTWGNSKTSVPIPADWTNIVAISSGYLHITALRSDGTVVTTGSSTTGMVNQPFDLENVVGITTSGDRDLAILGDGSPFITIPPVGRTILRGSNVSFTCKAVSLSTATYQWLYNGASIIGATNDTYSITKAQLTNSGAYQMAVSNQYGTVISKSAKLVVSLPLALALDTDERDQPNPGGIPYLYLNWTTSPGLPWFGETNVTHDQTDAAQSASIGNLQETVLTTSTNFSFGDAAAGGQVSFWWKVSSEAGFDTLEFRLNGTVLATISGEVNWQQRTFALTTGTNILQWRYSKDASSSFGSDAGWVDQVAFIPTPPVITVQPASKTVNVSNNVTFSIGVASHGTISYRWLKDGSNVLGFNNSITLTSVGRRDRGIYSCIVSNQSGAVTSSNALLTVRVPQSLGQVQFLPDGSATFTAGDIDGGLLSSNDLAHLTLQYSTNLTNWFLVPGALTLTNGTLQIQDSTATNSAARFFRIIEQ